MSVARMAAAYSWDEDNAETRELPGRLPANDAFDGLEDMATLARVPEPRRSPAGAAIEQLPLPPPRAGVVRGQLLGAQRAERSADALDPSAQRVDARVVPPAPLTPDTTPVPLAAPAHPQTPLPTPRPLPRSAPARGRWPLVATLAGTMSLVITLAVGVLWLMPPRGVLRIELTAPEGGQVSRAEVFVDGQKRCESAPCIVPDLAPGSRLVKVIAPGYSESTSSAEIVEVGRERVASITLRGAAVAGGSLRATGKQAGVHVSIDGVDRGVLPLSLEDVPAGTRRLRFHGERYQAVERTVNVSAGKLEDLGSIELPVSEGVLTVELRTPGAQVVLRREDGSTRDKVLPGPWPMAVQLDGAARWTVTATHEGHEGATYPVSFADGAADKRVVVELLPSGPTLAAVPEAPAPRAAAPRTAAKSEAGGMGTLHVNSLPVSKVLVDGRALGQTPQTNLALPAGKHTVTFIHGELGKKTVTVDVQPGRTATASVRFRR